MKTEELKFSKKATLRFCLLYWTTIIYGGQILHPGRNERKNALLGSQFYMKEQRTK